MLTSESSSEATPEMSITPEAITLALVGDVASARGAIVSSGSTEKDVLGLSLAEDWLPEESNARTMTR